MNRLVRLPVPPRAFLRREVRDAHERLVRQPAAPLERPVLDLAFPRSRKLVRLSLAGNRPIAEAKRANPEPRGLLREDRDAASSQRDRRVVFEPDGAWQLDAGDRLPEGA